jgi:hypothetical protein
VGIVLIRADVRRSAFPAEGAWDRDRIDRLVALGPSPTSWWGWRTATRRPTRPGELAARRRAHQSPARDGDGPGGLTATPRTIIDLLVTGVVIAAVVIGWRRLPLPYMVYALGCLLIPLSYPFEPRPLLSMPRLVAVIFPAFWVMADGTERGRLPSTVVVACFAAGLGLSATLFMNWWYIF